MERENRVVGEVKKEEEKMRETGDIYERQGIEDSVEGDQISTAEAGFVEGFTGPNIIECANCGKRIDFDSVVQRALGGETRSFCSERCAGEFERKNPLYSSPNGEE